MKSFAPALALGLAISMLAVALWMDSTRASLAAIADKPAITCRCECPANGDTP